METGYILTKSSVMLKEITDSLRTFPLLNFEGSSYIDVSYDFIREKNPYLVVLSEELSREDIESIAEKIKTDRVSDYIAVVLFSKNFNPSKWKVILEKNRIDGWIDDNDSEMVTSFTLHQICALVKIYRDFNKLRINNDYLQSEISYYDRKRMYKEGLEQKERTKDLINFMHFVRTYLTGIKGGVDLVLKENIGGEERNIATALVLRNIHKIEDYINQQDFTVKEEKKSKTVQPIILKLRPFILNLEKQLVYEGRKKSLTIFSDFPQSDHSVLAKTPDTEILIDSLLTSCLKAIKPGSMVRLGVKLLNSANMVEFSLKANKEAIDLDQLKAEISGQYDAMQILNDKDSKLELFDDTSNFGVRFYLPRLS
jgi:hypothetical protein